MKTDLILIAFLIVLWNVSCSFGQKLDHREVKCLVCKATVAEMEYAISLQDARKIAEVSGFRMDSSGNSVGKTIPLIKSEMYLTELMENICDKMDDYARAVYKDTGKLAILKLMSSTGGMNPDLSRVDFVQDGDLNKSLKHYCLEVLEDNEEAVLKVFMNEIGEDADIKICTNAAHYCNEKPIQEAYNLEDDDSRDEL